MVGAVRGLFYSLSLAGQPDQAFGNNAYLVGIMSFKNCVTLSSLSFG